MTNLPEVVGGHLHHAQAVSFPAKIDHWDRPRGAVSPMPQQRDFFRPRTFVHLPSLSVGELVKPTRLASFFAEAIRNPRNVLHTREGPYLLPLSDVS